jgi:hypothetical protein
MKIKNNKLQKLIKLMKNFRNKLYRKIILSPKNIFKNIFNKLIWMIKITLLLSKIKTFNNFRMLIK